MKTVDIGISAKWITVTQTGDGDLELKARHKSPNTLRGPDRFFRIAAVFMFFIAIWAGIKGYNDLLGLLFILVIASFFLEPLLRTVRLAPTELKFRGSAIYLRDRLLFGPDDDVQITVMPHRGRADDARVWRSKARRPRHETELAIQTAHEVIAHTGPEGAIWIPIAALSNDETGERAGLLRAAIMQTHRLALRTRNTRPAERIV